MKELFAYNKFHKIYENIYQYLNHYFYLFPGSAAFVRLAIFYIVSNDFITPWSIGCKTEVTFCGKNTSKLGTAGWAGQLVID